MTETAKNACRAFCAVFLGFSLSGCTSHEQESPPPPAAPIFADEATDKYSIGFSSGFPTDSGESSAVASGVSGKGPFVAHVACSEGGSMTLRVDDEKSHEVPCDGEKHGIDGIQKIAKTGGVKFMISSGKQSGRWQIQLVGAVA